MKVVILHQHFNTPESGGPLRSWYLGKALAEAGIEVHIMAGGRQRGYQMLEGMHVHWIPVAYDNSFGFYRRILSFVRYAVLALRECSRIPSLSVCYAISVPLTIGLTAMWLKQRRGVPYFFEVGDLWPDAPIELGFVRNPVLKRSLYSLEKRIYMDADKIVALSPAIRDAVKAKVPGKNIQLLTNISDTAFFLPHGQKQQQLVQRFGLNGKFVVSYIGAVGFANGLDYFLECARSAGRAGLDMAFVICGEGRMLESLKASANRLQLTNLTFIPLQNREGVRDLMSITDASFICYRSSAILETGSPHKYFDALAAGKLIILNFNGWIATEVREERCGIVLQPSAPHEFTTAIKPFLSNPGLLHEYGKNARKLAEEKYSRTKLSREFVSMFREDGL